MKSITVNDIVSHVAHSQKFTCGGVESHLPFCFPCSKVGKVILKSDGISLRYPHYPSINIGVNFSTTLDV